MVPCCEAEQHYMDPVFLRLRHRVLGATGRAVHMSRCLISSKVIERKPGPKKAKTHDPRNEVPLAGTTIMYVFFWHVFL